MVWPLARYRELWFNPGSLLGHFPKRNGTAQVSSPFARVLLLAPMLDHVVPSVRLSRTPGSHRARGDTSPGPVNETGLAYGSTHDAGRQFTVSDRESLTLEGR